MNKIQIAPKNIFHEILKWSVMPTFDLVIQYGDLGVIIVKRSIAPYMNQWALPGLRMYKPEGINDSLIRICKNELNLKIDTKKKILLDQYVGKFRTENNRQDLSTAYFIPVASNQNLNINPEHFTSYKFITSKKQIPMNTGAMYKYYLNKFFDKKYIFA